MPQLKMRFWKAGEAFDHSGDVIKDLKWRDKYPELYEVRPSPGSPFPIDGRTILPEEIVIEMAKKGTYMFGIGPDGGLACYYHEEEYISKLPPLIERVTPLEALMRCGGESVFYAADHGSAACGMVDRDIPED